MLYAIISYPESTPSIFVYAPIRGGGYLEHPVFHACSTFLMAITVLGRTPLPASQLITAFLPTPAAFASCS